jgi:hypothetical protein
MALPPQAADKLMHSPVATQGAFKQFILLAGALFTLMLVLYIGISFGYKAYLSKSIASTKTKIDGFSSQISQADQDKVANFYSQLQNLQQLLASHTTASPVLSLLERTTIPEVYYTKLSVNASLNQADVNGMARSLADVAKQAALIEAQTEVVDHVNFSTAGATQGGAWQFTMNIFLRPGVLHNGNPAPTQQSSQPVINTPAPSSTTGQATSTPTAQ